MTRNRAIRLLTLLVALFIPIRLPIPDIQGDFFVPAAYALYWCWAAITVLIGNCLIALWGEAR
jgi:hypothetical protein